MENAAFAGAYGLEIWFQFAMYTHFGMGILRIFSAKIYSIDHDCLTLAVINSQYILISINRISSAAQLNTMPDEESNRTSIY